MSKLITKARSGVTLVELLVVILIVTILSVSLLPLLKPYIEQAKYAAEVQPVLANIQTKINLFQYEKDMLPCTKASIDSSTKKKAETITNYDRMNYTWMVDDSKTIDHARVYKKASADGEGSVDDMEDSAEHLSDYVDVDWQDLMGKRMNPSQFSYHLIKGLGAGKYGYAIGVFGDGDGLALGTGYAILVLVDTDSKIKILATWERYKPKSNEVINFVAADSGEINNNVCSIPTADKISSVDQQSWGDVLLRLKAAGWSFNFSDDSSEE